MIAPLLKSALEPVVQRRRRLRFVDVLSIWWVVIAVAGGGFLIAGQATSSHMLSLAAFAILGAWILKICVARWEPNYREIARRIEARHPELHALLVTAVEQQPDPATGKLHYLQQVVLADAIRKTREHQWLDAISSWRWLGAGMLQCLALAALIVVLGGFELPRFGSHAATPLASAAKKETVEVTPGDASVERGSVLVVLAKFQGTVPGEASLVIQPENQPLQRMPLAKSLKDPVFGASLPEVASALKYHVEYQGKSTRDFTVTVFEHPRMDRADATLHYPEYTQLPDKSVPDTRRVSAVEGTKLDVKFALNKPVQTAVLVAKDGQQIPLTVDSGKAEAALRDFPIRKSQSYEVKLTDAEGRTNKVPAQFIVDALPNRRPELKFAMPKGDRRVSPVEEVGFRGEVWDDMGIKRYGLSFNVAGSGEKEIELGSNTRADERREFSHLLKLEELGVKPDELISWYLWAEDIGPDGKPRRTATDMYFGEVRPFEEIYRASNASQSEQEEQQRQQQQQGGGQGEQAEKLAQMQKQIIVATWNLKRAEDGLEKPDEKYLKDEPVVKNSQEDALTQVKSMAEKLEDPKSIALVDAVKTQMEAARDRLGEAAESTAPLPAALASEQSAYNALLKLSAHEFEVTRSRNRQQQGRQARANQQQLDELEMKDEKQRYETQREAAPQQNQQQREQLAILNRLKELAQRQQDINERIKELQAALQAAKTPKEQEDLQQQLKRLRDQEQQMLADLDESRQRMEQSPQQAQLSEERRKLDQTRSEAQQAAEAMERNAASQALASGTRAARQLQEMRDDLRKKSTGQFNDEMREMRSNARELAQKEEEIARAMEEMDGKQARPSLEGDGKREEIAEQLDKQKEQLAGLSEQMKRVSEEAEAAEPLLSKELYDTLRKSAQAGTDQKLQAAHLLAGHGDPAQARRVEEQARRDVEDVKTGVERAAESVLGNEEESLRQARSELDTLARQLEREIQQARPDLAQNNQRQGRQAQAENGQPGEQSARTGQRNRGGEQRDEGQGEQAQQDRQQGERTSQNGNANAQSREGRGQRTAQRGEGQDNREQPSSNEPQAGGQQGEQAQNGDPNAQNREGRGQRTAQRGEGRQGNGKQPGSDEAQPDDQRGEQAAQNGNANGRSQRTAQRGEGRQGNGERPNSDEAQPDGQPGEQTAQNGNANAQNRNGRGQRTAQRGEGRQGNGEQPGSEGAQPDGQPGEQTAQNGNGSPQRGQTQRPSSPQSPSPDGQQTGAQTAQAGRGDRQATAVDLSRNASASAEGGDGAGGGANPITGGGFVDWSDRLRNVEEMLDSPQLRGEAARIRELAKGVRVEFKRHATQPDWDSVKVKIGNPLAELRDRITEELARRDTQQNIVPIDRDPVPPKYAERVRTYYEELGRGK